MSYFSPPPRPEGAEQALPLSAWPSSPRSPRSLSDNLRLSGSSCSPRQSTTMAEAAVKATTGQLCGGVLRSTSVEKERPARSPSRSPSRSPAKSPSKSPSSSLKYNIGDFHADLQECVVPPKLALQRRSKLCSNHECERLKHVYSFIRCDLEELSESWRTDIVQQFQDAMSQQEEFVRGTLSRHEELTRSMSRQEQLLRNLQPEHALLARSGWPEEAKLSEAKLNVESKDLPKDLTSQTLSSASCGDKERLLQDTTIKSAIDENSLEAAKKAVTCALDEHIVEAEPESPPSPDNDSQGSLVKVEDQSLPPRTSDSMAELIKMDVASKRKTICVNHVSHSSSSVVTHLSMHEHMMQALRSDRFEHMSCLVSLLNLIFYGIEVEVLARQHTPGKHPTLVAIMALFTLYFGWELTMRLMMNRRAFFFGEEKWWNLVDSIVVLASVIEFIMDLIQSDKMFFRFCQIAKMLRLFRIIHAFRFLQDLKTLIHSIVSTMHQLVWTIALVLLLLYMFAIIFTEAATSSGHRLLETTHDGVWPCSEDGSGSDETACSLQSLYGDIGSSMLTLYMSITGGMDWSDAFDPLANSDVGPIFASLFLVYLTFTTLAVMNVVTAIFCQSAIDGAANQREVQMQKFEEQQETYSKQLHEVFKVIDSDGSGDLSMEEFEIGIMDPKVQTFFESMELRIQEARLLFQLLQSGEGNTIQIDDFVESCLQLRGSARNIDVALLRYECRHLSSKVGHLLRKAEEQDSRTALQAGFNCKVKAAKPKDDIHQAIDWKAYVK